MTFEVPMLLMMIVKVRGCLIKKAIYWNYDFPQCSIFSWKLQFEEKAIFTFKNFWTAELGKKIFQKSLISCIEVIMQPPDVVQHNMVIALFFNF